MFKFYFIFYFIFKFYNLFLIIIPKPTIPTIKVMTAITRIPTKYLYLGDDFLFELAKHCRPMDVEATDNKDDTVMAMRLYIMAEDIMEVCNVVKGEKEDILFYLFILSHKIIFLSPSLFFLIFNFFLYKIKLKFKQLLSLLIQQEINQQKKEKKEKK